MRRIPIIPLILTAILVAPVLPAHAALTVRVGLA